MFEVDWKAFAYKHSGHEQKAFESFCSMLFSVRFNQKGGLPRYTNHPYLETHPIEVGNDIVGWQAKYYEVSLSQKKSEIIGCIKNAKSEYPNLTKIIFYCNKDFGHGRGREKDPQTKREAESTAKELGLHIEWFMASQFESLSIVRDNSDIVEYYFSVKGTGLLEFRKQVVDTSRSHFGHIDENVQVNGKTFSIDRTAELACISKHEFAQGPLVLAGQSGVGKTAIIKLFLYTEETDTPVVTINCRNAASWISEGDVLGGFEGRSLNDVDSLFANNEKKYLIIDSAEGLLDCENPGLAERIIRFANNESWRTLYTVREPAAADLANMIQSEALHGSHKVITQTIRVNGFDNDDVREALSLLNSSYSIPNSVMEALSVPFYLKTLAKADGTHKINSISQLRDCIYGRVLIGSQSELKRLGRMRILHSLAMACMGLQVQYEIDDPYLKQLINEGIVIVPSKGNQPIFSHDFFEELVTDHYLESRYSESSCVVEFLKGMSRAAARRRIRMWLSRQAESNASILNRFVRETVADENSLSEWEDEIAIAVLKSTSPRCAVASIGTLMFQKECKLLHTFCRVIRYSCKEPDWELQKKVSNLDFVDNRVVSTIQMPTGDAWPAIIQSLYESREIMPLEKTSNPLNVLLDWSKKHPVGEVTRLAALTALKYYERAYVEEEFSYRYTKEIKLCIETILASAESAIPEVEALVDHLIEPDQHRRNDLLLVEALQQNYFETSHIACAAPKQLASFLKSRWLFEGRERLEHGSWFDYNRLETFFGITCDEASFYPCSAMQTPVYGILQHDPDTGFQLVNDIMNHCIGSLNESDLSEEMGVVELSLPNGSTTEFVTSKRLWVASRGYSSSPNLYVDICMAFERWLYDYIKNVHLENLEQFLCGIIMCTQSGSVVSIALSMAIEHWNDCKDLIVSSIASAPIIMLDSYRVQSESMHPKCFFFPNDQFHQNDREQMDSLKCRQMTLGDVALLIQVNDFLSHDMNDQMRYERIQNYIQGHREVAHSNGDRLFEALVERMDYNNLEATTIEKDGQRIAALHTKANKGHLASPIDCPLSKQQELRVLASKLYLWADKLWTGHQDGTYSDIHDVIQDVKYLIDGANATDIIDWHTIARVIAVIARDHYAALFPEEQSLCINSIVGRIESGEVAEWGSLEGEALLETCVLLSREEDGKASVVLRRLLADPFQRVASSIFDSVGTYYTSENQELIDTFISSYLASELLIAKRPTEFWNRRDRNGRLRTIVELLAIMDKVDHVAIERIQQGTCTREEIGDVTSFSSSRLAHLFILPPTLLANRLSRNDVSLCLNKVSANYNKECKRRFGWDFERLFCERLASWVLDFHFGFSSKEDYESIAPIICTDFRCRSFMRGFGRESLSQEQNMTFVINSWVSIVDITVRWKRPSWEYDASDRLTSSLLFIDSSLTKDECRRLFADDRWKSAMLYASRQLNGPNTLYAYAYTLDEVMPEWSPDGIEWIANIVRDRNWAAPNELIVNTTCHLEEICTRAYNELSEKLVIDGPLRNDLLTVLDFLISNQSSRAFRIREQLLG